MKEFNFPNGDEQILVCRSLVLVAKNTSSGMNKLTLWMLTAFAAGLTYLIGQDSTRFSSLKAAGLIYLAAAFVGFMQRWLAMLVANCAKVFKESEKLHDGSSSINVARFLIIYIDSLPGLQRTAAAWAATKLMKGDLVSTGRGLYRMVLWQSYFVTICGALVLWAAYVALKAI